MRRNLFSPILYALGIAAAVTAATITTMLAAAPTPYSGAPAAIPGTIRAETFDNGGEGVAYYDTSSGNNGGKARSTDVDIESSSDGGYDIGWTTPGEWLNYTVNVAASGAYSLGLRVATPSGATMHVGFNGSHGVWTAVSIPNTGGWQKWATVTIPVTLGSGVQQMTLLFDDGSVNLNRVAVSQSASVVPQPPPPPSSSGNTLSVATWNIRIDDNSTTHARVAMDTLMAIGPRPEVVVIQEAYSNLFSTYIDELEQQTGKTWYGVFATHCAPGNWNGSSCTTAWYQGIGIFSTHPILNSSSTLFAYADCWTSARAGLRAAIDFNGTTVQVFTTHLQTGSCTDVATARYNSMSKLKSWASNYSKPQIAAGDFNADPNQIDTTAGMLPAFLDTWSIVGSGKGFSAFVPSPQMKIDYWFTDAGLRAQPVSSQVFSGAGSTSDHYPVQTTFVIN
jgi:endonuclease/exonuclease/phosphatase family metal-dependent hydrolase